MSANSHPHPYGIMIAGNDLGTPQQSYLYCSAYGNGNFIVRGFGPSESATTDTVFSMTGRGASNEAVHKAAGPGQSVTQDIAVTVKADSVECAINGTVVGDLSQGRPRGAGQAQIHGRRLWPPVLAQH